MAILNLEVKITSKSKSDHAKRFKTMKLVENDTSYKHITHLVIILYHFGFSIMAMVAILDLEVKMTSNQEFDHTTCFPTTKTV